MEFYVQLMNEEGYELSVLAKGWVASTAELEELIRKAEDVSEPAYAMITDTNDDAAYNVYHRECSLYPAINIDLLSKYLEYDNICTLEDAYNYYMDDGYLCDNLPEELRFCVDWDTFIHEFYSGCDNEKIAIDFYNAATYGKFHINDDYFSFDGYGRPCSYNQIPIDDYEIEIWDVLWEGVL